MSEQWFVAYCKSREELRAQQNLQNQGIHSFFPKIRKNKIVRGKKVIIEEALFPGYLFILTDKENSAFPKIRSTRGVNDLVKFGNKIISVPETLIENLKKLCYSLNDISADDKFDLKKGDKVEILSGSFQGLTAIFKEQDGLERSLLFLKLLNQENTVSFSNHSIRKLDN